MKSLITFSGQIFDHVPEITTEKDFNTILPFVKQAERVILTPIIGKEMLTFLQNFDANSSGSESASASESSSESQSEKLSNPDANVLKHTCQRICAYSFAFEFSKTGDVHFSSMGLQSIETQSHKGVFEYQKRDVMNAYAQRLDESIDHLLDLLDEIKPAIWPKELRGKYTTAFILNAFRFSNYCNIFNSHRTFAALKPLIEDAELIRLKPVIGEQLLEKLKLTASGRKKDTDSEQRVRLEGILISVLIPRALANFAIADAIDTVSLRVFADGVSFASYLGLSERKMGEAITEKEVRKRAHLTRGETYLAEIRELLQQNTDIFPEYTPLDPAISTSIPNTAESNHFII
jgi:hypothetical protein